MKKQKFKCDGCGDEVYDTPHKDYDENLRLQRGIKLCTGCKYGTICNFCGDEHGTRCPEYAKIIDED